MPLKNSQYNAILRRYDQLRFESIRQLDARRQEVYAAIPQLRQLDEVVARDGHVVRDVFGRARGSLGGQIQDGADTVVCGCLELHGSS